MDLYSSFSRHSSHLLARPLSPPQDWEENPELGLWVKRQRIARAAGQLSDERLSILQSMGFAFGEVAQLTEEWEHRFDQVRIGCWLLACLCFVVAAAVGLLLLACIGLCCWLFCCCCWPVLLAVLLRLARDLQPACAAVPALRMDSSCRVPHSNLLRCCLYLTAPPPRLVLSPPAPLAPAGGLAAMAQREQPALQLAGGGLGGTRRHHRPRVGTLDHAAGVRLEWVGGRGRDEAAMRVWGLLAACCC